VSSIEWTDVTDNIIAVEGGGWWCRKISSGCAHCYAARLNQNSFFGGNKLAYSGESPPLVLRRDICDSWARQRVPKKHFVASMTDVFGEWVPQEWMDYFLDAMAAAPLQTFQVLTKRPVVAMSFIAIWLSKRGLVELPGNIWIGVSVEDQTQAELRIPRLLEIPARVRFLSCEPLLGPVVLSLVDLGLGQPPDSPKIGWVICGGESGPRARVFHAIWAAVLRDQCAAAGVPFFMKQMGGERKPFRPIPDELMVREFPTVEVGA
jgi:protein gp37